MCRKIAFLLPLLSWEQIAVGLSSRTSMSMLKPAANLPYLVMSS